MRIHADPDPQPCVKSPISFIGSYIYDLGYCPGGRTYTSRENNEFILLPSIFYPQNILDTMIGVVPVRYVQQVSQCDTLPKTDIPSKLRTEKQIFATEKFSRKRGYHICCKKIWIKKRCSFVLLKPM
jgi:hypothetical protein